MSQQIGCDTGLANCFATSRYNTASTPERSRSQESKNKNFPQSGLQTKPDQHAMQSLSSRLTQSIHHTNNGKGCSNNQHGGSSKHPNMPGSGGKSSGIESAQIFNTPTGSDSAGPALPGGSFEFTVNAKPGQNLSFASMLGASNDQFVGTGSSKGIPLYDQKGQPLEGDITDLLAAWDTGTEANEAFGMGANQPASQSGPNTGPADPNNRVRLSDGSDGRPPIADLVNASLKYNGDGSFTVTLNNVSGSNGGATTGLAPGVAVVHDEHVSPLFTAGKPDRGAGLEALAEDGNPSQLLASLNKLL